MARGAMHYLAAAAAALLCGAPARAIWTQRPTCSQSDQCCVPESYCARERIEWTSEGGEIFMNGKPIQIKGVSWSGFESDLYMLRGLGNGKPGTFKATMAFLQNIDVNALRIPISLELVLKPDVMIRGGSCDPANEELCPDGSDGGQRPFGLDVLEEVVRQASYFGMVVTLDMQALTVVDGMGTIKPEFWYDHKFNERDLIAGWNYIIGRFSRYNNIMGIGLMNNLHGYSSWGDSAGGDPEYGQWDPIRDLPTAHDWHAAAQRIIKGIGKENADFNGLFFIQGVEGKDDISKVDGSIYDQFDLPEREYEYFHGSDLEGLYEHRVNPALAQASWGKRVVYSVNLYPPSTDSREYPKSYFPPAAKDFPDNMERVWDAQIKKIQIWGLGAAVVIGAWGGGDGKAWDEDWHLAFVRWGINNCITNNFYWELSSSASFGGIMQAKGGYDQMKLSMMAGMQSEPTKFDILRFSDGCTCVKYGSHTNPRCCKDDCPSLLCDPSNPFMTDCYDPDLHKQDDLVPLSGARGQATLSVAALASSILIALFAAAQ